MNNDKHPKKNQRGMSLLEVLISLFIMAIGLLGMMALQASSLQSNQQAYYRTQASLMASEMAEKMRSNRQGLLDGGYDSPSPQQHASCRSTSCDSDEMAENDMFEWSAALAASLPGGEGDVCRLADIGNVDTNGFPDPCNGGIPSENYVIYITWDLADLIETDTDGSVSSAPKAFYYLTVKP